MKYLRHTGSVAFAKERDMPSRKGISAYNIPIDDVIDRLVAVAVRITEEKMTLCFSPRAKADQKDFQYLRGVIHARIDGHDPPYEVGDLVFGSGDQPIQGLMPGCKLLDPDAEWTVERVWYIGNRWYLEIRSDDPLVYTQRYPARSFYGVIPEKPTSPA